MNRLGDMRDASVVVTGRFHGACLSVVAQRPFVAVSSNTHKIEGLCRDAELGPGAVLLADAALGQSAFDSIDRAIGQARDVAETPGALSAYQESCRAYSRAATTKAAEVFRSIAALA